jgi:hypothetical protein
LDFYSLGGGIMKFLFVVLTLLALQITIKSQTLPEWYRVYTFEESTIELNTNYVVFSNHKTERVRFRWIFSEPQSLSKESQIKYQSLVEEIGFNCENEGFRLYTIQWFDAAGKSIQTKNITQTEDLNRVKTGTMMEKLFEPACKLIKLRKREPAIEQ